MKKLTLLMAFAFALCVSAAVAQGGSQQGSQGSPSNQGSTGASGMGRPDSNNPNMGTSQDQNSTMGNESKGERRLKGCVQSQGGQYMLETKKGKDVALTGQDVSAHAGHEVELKGSWESGGGAGMSQSSSGTTSERTFNVSSVKMISDTCGAKGKSGSNMGNPNSPTNNGTVPAGSSTGGNGPQSQ